ERGDHREQVPQGDRAPVEGVVHGEDAEEHAHRGQDIERVVVGTKPGERIAARGRELEAGHDGPPGRGSDARWRARRRGDEGCSSVCGRWTYWRRKSHTLRSIR